MITYLLGEEAHPAGGGEQLRVLEPDHRLLGVAVRRAVEERRLPHVHHLHLRAHVGRQLLCQQAHKHPEPHASWLALHSYIVCCSFKNNK